MSNEETRVGMETEKETDANTIIYDNTHECDDALEWLKTNLKRQESLLSETWPYDRISGLRNSFTYWIDFTGALAPVGASLDDRLRHHGDIKEMIVELLEMISRNTVHRELTSLLYQPISLTNNIAIYVPNT